MAAIVYDNFRGGLDLRKNKAVAPAIVQYVLRNAYITTGYAIRKRPCARKVAILEPGTAGLKAGGGVLNTFYESGAIVHANALFKANRAAHPTTSQPVARAHFGEMFNGYLYAVLEYRDGSVWHQYFDGTVPPRVVDANCPQTKETLKLKQKMYGKSGSNVRFSATAAPRDWTAVSDAGFIAAGDQAAGSNVVTALGDYLGDLIVFFDDSLQDWLVDPDPANFTLKTNASIGTKHHNTAQTLAGDLILLAKPGFRSVSQVALSANNNLQESDVGSPIDKLRDEIADTDLTRMVFYPLLGQLWTINGSTVYVYSYSKTNKLSAWSTFEFPFEIDDATVLNSSLYMRSGDTVYVIDAAEYTDDGVVPLVEAELGYQDGKAPGILKMFTGFDFTGIGSAEIAFGYDSRNVALATDYVTLTGDTRPDALAPMDLSCVSISPKFRHQLNEEFQIDALQLYYERLGAV